jgi:hypothetical protein
MGRGIDINHHKFNAWNPFLKVDPNVKNTHSGPDSGVGAVCSWDGNKDIGAGYRRLEQSFRPARGSRLAVVK